MKWYIDPFWADVDLEPLARNWRQDSTGAQRRMQNSAAAMQRLARATNHMLAMHPRVMFARAQVESRLNRTSGNPLLVYSYMDRVQNGRTHVVRAICLPRPSTSSGTASLAVDGQTIVTGANATASEPRFPEDLFFVEADIERGNVTNARWTGNVTTNGGFTVVDIVVQDKIVREVDTSVHACAPELQAVVGEYILADALASTRSALHEGRLSNLSVEFYWSAQANASGTWETSGLSGVGDERGIRISSSTYVNVLDQTVTSRSATSPGNSCPCYASGVGQGQSVYLECSVFAVVAFGSGATVKFEGPLGSVEIAITATGSPAWHTATAKLPLDATVADDDATVARNKVDVFAKCVGVMYIYGYVAERVYKDYVGCADCSGGCSHGCSSSCVGGCTSCTGTCSDSCSGGCSSSCYDTCTGGCLGACTSCSGSCIATCSTTCTGTCGGTCGSTCMITCSDGCFNTCQSGCDNMCLTACSSCTGTCTGSCSSACSVGCSSSCDGTCTTSCASSCGGTCQASCALGATGVRE